MQEPIHRIRQKHTQDATQVHRKSNPASHLRREPHCQNKTDISNRGTDISEKRTHLAITLQKMVVKGGRGRLAEPQVRPNLDWFPAPSASEGRLPPPSQRRLPAFPRFSHQGTDLSTLYKGPPQTLSSHSQFSFIPQGEGVVVGLHLYH